ncbi:unnamed protein product [Prunus armeniaca]
MKAMPLSFEQFQGKGVLDFSSSISEPQPPQNQHLHHHHNQQQQQQKWNQNSNKENCYVGNTEPTSVVDTRRSPSPSTSSSALSSSLGGGGANGSGGGGPRNLQIPQFIGPVTGEVLTKRRSLLKESGMSTHGREYVKGSQWLSPVE